MLLKSAADTIGIIFLMAFCQRTTNQCGRQSGGICPFVRKIEVETENLDMVKEAVEAGADIIMLDNMTAEDMKEAVKITAGRAKTECSGNVTRENIEKLKEIGVDYISCGALTHSAPILDDL